MYCLSECSAIKLNKSHAQSTIIVNLKNNKIPLNFFAPCIYVNKWYFQGRNLDKFFLVKKKNSKLNPLMQSSIDYTNNVNWKKKKWKQKNFISI